MYQIYILFRLKVGIYLTTVETLVSDPCRTRPRFEHKNGRIVGGTSKPLLKIVIMNVSIKHT